MKPHLILSGLMETPAIPSANHSRPETQPELRRGKRWAARLLTLLLLSVGHDILAVNVKIESQYGATQVYPAVVQSSDALVGMERRIDERAKSQIDWIRMYIIS